MARLVAHQSPFCHLLHFVKHSFYLQYILA